MRVMPRRRSRAVASNVMQWEMRFRSSSARAEARRRQGLRQWADCPILAIDDPCQHPRRMKITGTPRTVTGRNGGAGILRGE